MKEDDFKKNEFADFDEFDEDEDFDTEVKVEEDRNESNKPVPTGSVPFNAEDVIVEVLILLNYDKRS